MTEKLYVIQKPPFQPNCYETVRLYVYDWVIDDFKFVRCLRPTLLLSPEYIIGDDCRDVLQLQLYPAKGGNDFKVKVMFKGLGLESSNKRYSCSTSSKLPEKHYEASKNPLIFDVSDVALDFLDFGGKVVDSLNFVPPADSKHFTWEPDREVYKFVSCLGSLKLRLNLGIGYRTLQTRKSSSKSYEHLNSKSCVTLINDLERLSVEGSFSDLVVKVSGIKFPVHKCILLPQFEFLSKSVSELKTISSEMQKCSLADNTEAVEAVSIPGCKVELFKVLLQYFYAGKVCRNSAVSHFDLLDFSQKYALCELSRNLRPRKLHVRTQVQKMIRRFQWRVTEVSIKSLQKFETYESPEFETSDGETWCIMFHFFGCDTCDRIYLSLKKVSKRHHSHSVYYFRLSVFKPDGTPHEERQFVQAFRSRQFVQAVRSGKPVLAFSSKEEPRAKGLPKDVLPLPTSYPGFLDPESRFSIPPGLFEDALDVGCEITICDGLQTREVTMVSPGEPGDFVSRSWHRNLQSLLDSGDMSDVTLTVGQADFKVHKAILSARSPVFAAMFEADMLEKLSGSVKIEDVDQSTVSCALRYIYTGSLDVLTMDKAPELFRFADKYQMLSLKETCAEFIVNHLDASHACEVMILAELCDEKNMLQEAKGVVCRNAREALLSEYGQELLMNHPTLANDVLDSLSAAFCSLPPQEGTAPIRKDLFR